MALSPEPQHRTGGDCLLSSSCSLKPLGMYGGRRCYLSFLTETLAVSWRQQRASEPPVSVRPPRPPCSPPRSCQSPWCLGWNPSLPPPCAPAPSQALVCAVPLRATLPPQSPPSVCLVFSQIPPRGRVHSSQGPPGKCQAGRPSARSLPHSGELSVGCEGRRLWDNVPAGSHQDPAQFGCRLWAGLP